MGLQYDDSTATAVSPDLSGLTDVALGCGECSGEADMVMRGVVGERGGPCGKLAGGGGG